MYPVTIETETVISPRQEKRECAHCKKSILKYESLQTLTCNHSYHKTCVKVLETATDKSKVCGLCSTNVKKVEVVKLLPCSACLTSVFNIDEHISEPCGHLFHNKCHRILKLNPDKTKICPGCVSLKKKETGPPQNVAKRRMRNTDPH